MLAEFDVEKTSLIESDKSVWREFRVRCLDSATGEVEAVRLHPTG